MDVVEGPFVRPYVLDVVDFELAVRRGPGGLDGREVGADYVRGLVAAASCQPGYLGWGERGEREEGREGRQGKGKEAHSAKSIAHIPVPVPQSRTR